MNPSNHRARLEGMISTQLEDRGITDEEILDAFRSNPRHLFVPGRRKDEAYSDRPLPIGEGQTISQPYIVALMTDLLSPDSDDRVLEIGTGSGFQTAILASLAAEVFTVERKESLLEEAKKVHRELGIENVHYKYGDGTTGWKEEAPFDRILGTGSVPEVPESLIDQLGQAGKIVLPVGSRRQQRLVTLTKRGEEVLRREDAYCSFLPLIGKEGWEE
ncbi:MAG: protein-L-isoaspartate(D-aspartate) O-methyltransferase [Candidatus Acetothermia bacterium]